jgi:acetyl esterase
MPLHSAAKALMDQIAAGGEVRLEEMSPAEARDAFAGMSLLDGEPVAIAAVRDLVAEINARDVALRLYRPDAEARPPVIVYFHGGGWVIGDLDTHDNTCRRLARASGCAVVAVDYRRAPEHPFPAAAEDCYAAVAWVVDNATALEVDGTRLAVAGDSAGGNLAAVVSLMARDRGGPQIAFQLLIYPATERGSDTESMRTNAEGYFLTRAAMLWFWQHYAPPSVEFSPYHSPLGAESLAELPPALVITAEYDPLRDEGEAYALRLSDSGVPVTLRRYDGMIHGFVSMAGVLPHGAEAIAEAGAMVREALGAARGDG